MATKSTKSSSKKPQTGSVRAEATNGQHNSVAQEEHQFLQDLDKKLWTAADKLRSSLDAAVYKHVVLGLVFLKYVSDSFEARQQEVEAQLRDKKSDLYLDPEEYGSGGRLSAEAYAEAIRDELEERDYYTAKNIFWVPALARWKTLQDNAKVPSGTTITVINGKKEEYKFTSLGRLIDDALEAIEKENPKLKNVLNKTYTQLQLDPANLSSPIDLIATIPFVHGTMQAKDKATAVVESFRQFLAAKRDELTALRIYYSQPYRRKEVTFKMVQEVVEVMSAPPYNLNLAVVWSAYERSEDQMKIASLPLARSENEEAAPDSAEAKPATRNPSTRNPSTRNPSTRNAPTYSAQRQLTDLVALIHYELKVDDALRPYAETVKKNFQDWVFRKQAGNIKFTEAQMEWLRLVRDHIVTSVHIVRDDLELGTMGQQGGLARMHQLFDSGGPGLRAGVDSVLDELNEMVSA